MPPNPRGPCADDRPKGSVVDRPQKLTADPTGLIAGCGQSVAYRRVPLPRRNVVAKDMMSDYRHRHIELLLAGPLVLLPAPAVETLGGDARHAGHHERHLLWALWRRAANAPGARGFASASCARQIARRSCRRRSSGRLETYSSTKKISGIRRPARRRPDGGLRRPKTNRVRPNAGRLTLPRMTSHPRIE
jgi:hypothetical protein